LMIYTEVLRAELESEGIGVSALIPGPVNTRIWEAERSRPAEFGERRDMARPERAAVGLDPTTVGDLVVKGILANEGYIFTNAGSRARVEERLARMSAALDIAEGGE
jgi:short-subunit dehydrogenase